MPTCLKQNTQQTDISQLDSQFSVTVLLLVKETEERQLHVQQAENNDARTHTPHSTSQVNPQCIYWSILQSFQTFFIKPLLQQNNDQHHFQTINYTAVKQTKFSDNNPWMFGQQVNSREADVEQISFRQKNTKSHNIEVYLVMFTKVKRSQCLVEHTYIDTLSSCYQYVTSLISVSMPTFFTQTKSYSNL